MQTYQCPNCEARIFFENLRCLACNTELGYLPADKGMVVVGMGAAHSPQPCVNREAIACNWALAQTDAAPALCDCCRYTQTIPPLDKPEHLGAWARFEQAKRYLFYSLYQLQLPIPDRTQLPEGGLAFQLLAPLPDQPKVITGHDAGLITINANEADDARREQNRVALHEPYRTMLGHLRHESGHLYWDLLIANSQWLDAFRKLFGDECRDYGEALQAHYANADTAWADTDFISRYASSHPWEDWAETWAHYLHIVDALDTATHWRISLSIADTAVASLPLEQHLSAADFKQCLISVWLPLSQYLNAACRSLGEADAYPFLLPPVVVDKLTFIHGVLGNHYSKGSDSSDRPIRHSTSSPAAVAS